MPARQSSPCWHGPGWGWLHHRWVYPRDVILRIVIAEDNLLVREGIKSLIDSQPELQVVGTCGDLDSLVATVDTEKPDVVLTDIRMPPTETDEGIRFAEEVRAGHPGLGVVVLSQFDDPAFALALLDKGSQGRAYLLKERVGDVAQIVNAVKEVAAGGSVIDPKIVDNLLATRAGSSESALSRLTQRESEVLGEMARGKNNAGIAATLVLTERAVEKHINSIFSKLGLSEEKKIHRRVKAVLLYLSEAE